MCKFYTYGIKYTTTKPVKPQAPQILTNLKKHLTTGGEIVYTYIIKVKKKKNKHTRGAESSLRAFRYEYK